MRKYGTWHQTSYQSFSSRKHKFAFAHPQSSADYVKFPAQEMNRKWTRNIFQFYVKSIFCWSVWKKVKAAIHLLFQKGKDLGLPAGRIHWSVCKNVQIKSGHSPYLVPLFSSHPMIVVTSATGFIGSCLVSRLLQKVIRNIVVVDDFSIIKRSKIWLVERKR